MESMKTLAVTALALAFLASCAKDEYGDSRPLNQTEKGAMIGAATGAVVVGLAAKDKKGKKMLIGAVGGGLVGAGVGAYMDSQRKDFEKQLASEVKNGSIQISKRPNDSLLVTMTAQTAFDVNAAAIKQGFRATLNKTASILTHYGKTHLTVMGHTDSTGTKEYNQTLSQRRAQSVDAYLRTKGVIPQRIQALGRGEGEPRASNSTEDGRRLNRRVEILIEPIVDEAG